MTTQQLVIREDEIVGNTEFIEYYLEEIANGNIDMLGNLYQSTSNQVYGYALAMLKNTQDAQDVTHDCYLMVHRAASQYHKQGKPLAWILTITRNLCLEKMRKGNKETIIEVEDWMMISNESISEEEKLTINYCLNELNDTEREIVMLHAITGFKHREIASLLKMSLPAVLSKYNRAIKKVREKLEAEGY